MKFTEKKMHFAFLNSKPGPYVISTIIAKTVIAQCGVQAGGEDRESADLKIHRPQRGLTCIYVYMIVCVCVYVCIRVWVHVYGHVCMCGHIFI